MRWILKNILSKVLVFLVIFMAGLFVNSSNWLIDTFDNLTPESIIFHIFMPLQGTDNTIISSFISNSLIPSVILGVIGLVCYVAVFQKAYIIEFLWEGTRRVYELNIGKYNRLAVRVLLGAVTISSIVYASFMLDFNDYIAFAFTDSDFIERHYVDPRSANIVFPEVRRNLIFIYLESIETSFMSVEDGGGSETNLIPELTELARNYVHFSNTDKFGGALQSTGTGWTIAGMFATTSGLPLILPIGGNAMAYHEYFAPGVYPLGRILQREGYNQVLIVGSDARFGGRYQYFTQHGNYTIKDVFTAERDFIIPEGRRVWWGFEDERLYVYAKRVLDDLSSREEPFNLTLLTVDSHRTDGWVCRLCPEIYERQYNNVIRCTSRQLYDFIRWIQTQDFYENTSIVITGDHLTMQVDMEDYFYYDHERTIFNVVINSAIQPQNDRNRIFTLMDWFPTTLASMGVTIEGDRLGLGTNLFSDLRTLAEEYGFETFDDELRARSRFYTTLLIP